MADVALSMVDRDFWRGRRVLVTGHTGFKGSWLCLWLQSLGASVTGFSGSRSTKPSLYELARVGEGMDSIAGDVCDPTAVARAVEACDPEVVFHAAAQALVRRSFEEPRETYETNVMGTVNVLDAVRLKGANVRAIVSITSDKCYENREWEWGYRESEPMGGHDPYSSSKGCAELVTAAFRNSFFSSSPAGHPARLGSARAGNVIGGGDWGADRLVPDIMRAALAGEPIRVRNPNSIRPWQHVLNPLSGYMVLAQALWDAPEHAAAWNFGPPDEDARPVGWLVRTARRDVARRADVGARRRSPSPRGPLPEAGLLPRPHAPGVAPPCGTRAGARVDCGVVPPTRRGRRHARGDPGADYDARRCYQVTLAAAEARSSSVLSPRPRRRRDTRYVRSPRNQPT